MTGHSMDQSNHTSFCRSLQTQLKNNMGLLQDKLDTAWPKFAHIHK